MTKLDKFYEQFHGKKCVGIYIIQYQKEHLYFWTDKI